MNGTNGKLSTSECMDRLNTCETELLKGLQLAG